MILKKTSITLNRRRPRKFTTTTEEWDFGISESDGGRRVVGLILPYDVRCCHMSYGLDYFDPSTALVHAYKDGGFWFNAGSDRYDQLWATPQEFERALKDVNLI